MFLFFGIPPLPPPNPPGGFLEEGTVLFPEGGKLNFAIRRELVSSLKSQRDDMTFKVAILSEMRDKHPSGGGGGVVAFSRIQSNLAR